MKAIAVKWLTTPTKDNTGALKLNLIGGQVEMPFLAETRNVDVSQVPIGEECEYEMLLEAMEINIYENEQDFDANDTSKMAAQALIPIALNFYESNKPDDGLPITAAVKASVLVTEVCEDPAAVGFESGDLVAETDCLGYKFYLVIPPERTDAKSLSAGNIISGIFFVWAWSAEE